MLELLSARKIKVNLADYDCQSDIENRMLMADFSAFDLEVLKEILYSPLKISIKKLSRTMECDESDLAQIINKLSVINLFSIQDGFLFINKDMRKYFESQIIRFDPSFKPDMEFLASLLKKVPIHCLPIWYALPRTSNNIFESIVEKYLLTPQIFQRHLLDLHFSDPVIQHIISDLFVSSELKLYSSDVISKYNLTRHHFEEILLLLEFNFIGCLSYEKADDHWVEIITPFYEWLQYLRFLKTSEASCIPQSFSIIRTRPNPFSFVEDMGTLLSFLLKKPASIGNWMQGEPISSQIASLFEFPCSTLPDVVQTYLAKIVQKLFLFELIVMKGTKTYASDKARSWVGMTLEKRALHLYRHPENRAEKTLRDVEKSIKRVLHGHWVFFDDFMHGVIVPFNEGSTVMLKQTGKQWKYTIPIHEDEIKSLIKSTIFESLFEAGLTATGICDGKECFSVTPFGRCCFAD